MITLDGFLSVWDPWGRRLRVGRGTLEEQGSN